MAPALEQRDVLEQLLAELVDEPVCVPHRLAIGDVCEPHIFMTLEIYVSHMASTSDTDWKLPDPFPTTPADVADTFGERNPEILAEFEDGGFVVKFAYAGGKYDPLTGGIYYVPPGTEDNPDGEPWEDWWEVRGGYQRNERTRRALLIGRLNERTGFYQQAAVPGNGVPLDVALDGQKAIAAYLFAWQQLGPEAIASKMEKSPQTIRQYLSDYKAGRTG